MKAISIKQPWAYLICAGFKDIENRKWRTSYRGRIYVHASKQIDHSAQEWLMRFGFSPLFVLMLYSNKIPRGAIMGEVDIIDCVTESESPWFAGPYGFVLSRPTLYRDPIPMKGKLGFFEVELGLTNV